jgi:hypothetical protein
MKRVTIRPGKVVLVSEEALARARQGLKAFGVTSTQLDRLATFKGDVSIGTKVLAKTGRPAGVHAGRKATVQLRPKLKAL